MFLLLVKYFVTSEFNNNFIKTKRLLRFLFYPQTILSSKPEGDSHLSNLRRQYESMCERDDLEKSTRDEAQRVVKDTEELWTEILQRAENALKKAEVQYSLSRELEAFHAQARSTKSWVDVLQKQAKCKEGGTHGTQVQIEDRFNTAQVKHGRGVFIVIIQCFILKKTCTVFFRL